MLCEIVHLCFCTEAVHPLSAYDADYSDSDERQTEQLPHVDEHVSFEGFLYVFGIFDEEAESED